MQTLRDWIFSFFFISRQYKQLISVLSDSVLLLCAMLLSLAVHNFPFPADSIDWSMVLMAVISCQFVLFLLGFYKSMTRYLSLNTIIILVAGSTIAPIVFRLISLYFNRYWGFWFSEMLVTMMMICLLLGGIRMLVLSFFSNYTNRQKTPVIIYGAGDTGQQLAGSLLNGRQYFPVAFVDGDESKQGLQIRGIKIFPPQEVFDLAKKMQVDTVMLAVPKMLKSDRQNLIASMIDRGLSLKTVPSLEKIVNGKLKADDYQNVSVDELLGREPVVPQESLFTKNITNKTVFVSGAGGSIGSELTRQIANYQPKCLLLFEASEYALYQISQEINKQFPTINTVILLGNVQDGLRLQKIFSHYQVDTIYHAAAYKHVPIVEYNVIPGVANNVLGTYQLAHAATQAKVSQFVLISTDKAVRPTNIMGASKRFAELVLQALDKQSDTCFTMVRFGNVLGSSGSVVPLFRQQILVGGPVTVTHKDIIRYFMTIPEAAQLVIQAGALGQGGDVFVLDMGEPVKIDDLARRMIALMGYKLKDSEHSDGIDIQYSGLRPGEKLYEELLIDADVEQTSHPRIMRANEFALEWPELAQLLERLKQYCEQYDYAAIQALFLEAPLNFNPDNANGNAWLANDEPLQQHVMV